MTDTLILFKPLADFGEALKKECPKNDCTSYLYTYEQYCAIYADYKRIKETIADLSEAAVRVLEHAIRKTEAELYKMWFENYAVLKQRAALGMAASAERRATSSGKTNFEALTADAQGLGRFLRSLPVLEAPWDTEFQKRYCSGCVAENCDACPNERFRTIPKISDTAAFCHSSNFRRSVRPSQWWQKFSIKRIALFAFFALKRKSPS